MKLLTILFFIFSASITSLNEEDKIAWNSKVKLSWYDFKAAPKNNSGFVASTSSGISFSYTFSYKETGEILNLDVIITSYFYPNKSWYIPSEASDYILNHEQAHFDISELHARMLRKEISEATFSKNLKKEIEAIYNRVEKKRRDMQHLFDNESNHSKVKEKEKEWEIFISRQLNKYDRWD